MRLLVLGGTAWLGEQVATAATVRGHDVTCLARGESGDPPPGVRFVRGDRSAAGGYDAVADEVWDACIDVARQPGHVRSAVTALAGVRHYVFVSSVSVYVDTTTPGADETSEVFPALGADAYTDPEEYGPAKVACEDAVRAAFDGRAFIARAGLIGGPGDWSGRTGYWPLRFVRPAVPDGRVLVPDEPALGTQVVDVRDLAAWLVDVAEQGRSGTVDAVGPMVPLAEHIETARTVAGHTGPVVSAAPAWLAAQGVQPWMGPRSLPLWLPLPEYAGFGARDTSAARLPTRPLSETLADTLAWELAQPVGRERRAGLTDDQERELLALLD